ncbi:hypothetical protein TrRE_jg188 [Triparma retinervis]|uniref:Uncharacterized protein n=1 Tax=Triparma retinervis TaxID=2557542 RepID=A0A9W7DQQ8_9STRA|nr:hypothetical protein TrRE_jg188 [Triparma retinervis]
MPLLRRTGGCMVVRDWGRTCYDTLLQFYDVVGEAGDAAVLKPKGGEELGKVKEGGSYEWCFSFKGRSKTLRVGEGPFDTQGVMEKLSEHVGGCKDMGQSFYCDNDGDGKKVNCLSCFDALMAISKRGFWLMEGIDKIVKDEFAVEL